MEKNEAFRKQVLSRLYGISELTEPAKEETAEDAESEDTKDKDEEKKDEEPVKKDSTEEKSVEEAPAEKTVTEKEKEGSEESGDKKDKKDKEEVNTDHSNNNEDSSTVTTESPDKNSTTTSTTTTTTTTSSSKSNATHTTPTTTTSHLYSVLMAPLDGRSSYRDNLRSASQSDRDSDSSQRKRMRLDNTSSEKVTTEDTTESRDHTDTKTTTNTNSPVGMDLSKNQKKKLKKKKRKNLLNRLEVQRAKEFIYSSENEQYSVEKLRTMIEDVTEFLDAIWDVYYSEARLKGESVEEDGYKVAAVLKCLSASGEGSWVDLQLLSRAKSVLVLRSKNLAASTIARVENELGYDTDIRTFIVRMLKFWMDHVVTKG